MSARLAYSPAVAAALGPNPAILLAQMLYWAERSPRPWFYKTALEWQAETGLARTRFETARRKLIAAGLVEAKRIGYAQTLFYRVDLGAVRRLTDGLEPTAAKGDVRAEKPAMAIAGNLQWAMQETCNGLHKISKRFPKQSVIATGDSSIDDFQKSNLETGQKEAPERIEVHASWANSDGATETVPLEVSEIDAIADALHDAWPVHENRAGTRREFREVLRRGLSRSEIEPALRAAAAYFEDCGRDRRYIPSLSTWLRDARWTDAPRAAKRERPASTGKAARRGEDPDLARWRARGTELLRAEPAGVASRDPSPPEPSPQPEAARPAPQPEPAERKDHQPTGADVMEPTLEQAAGLAPGDGQPEAARPAPEPSRPASEPEAALAPGERVISHSEHMAMIAGGQCGPAVARGERRAGWPEHLRDAPKPLPPDPSLPPGSRVMSFAEVCALQDAQRAERAALRAERCGARRRPAPQPGAFA